MPMEPPVIRTDELSRRYGNRVVLTDDQGDSIDYKIAAEFQLEGRVYAALMPGHARKDGEIELFRVNYDEDGLPELTTIDDEEEWEQVSEAYDDLFFAQYEQP